MLERLYPSTFFLQGEAYFDKTSNFNPDVFVLGINLGLGRINETKSSPMVLG